MDGLSKVPTSCGRLPAVKRFGPALVGGLFLLLYTLTAGPSIVELFDDTLEFQLVVPTFGIAHPTGYPLYVITGGLFTRLLPMGNWAWRVNLFSALCAATAVVLLFLLARRLCTWPDGTDTAVLAAPEQWGTPLLLAIVGFAVVTAIGWRATHTGVEAS